MSDFNYGNNFRSSMFARAYENEQRNKFLQQGLNEDGTAPERSALDRFFDVLQIGQYASAGFAKGLMDGKGGLNPFEGAWQGIKAGNPFGSGYEKGEHTYGQVLDEAGWQPTSFAGKAARGVVGFGLDVALDPLTYATFGTSALLKGTGTAAGKFSGKAATVFTQEAAEQALRRAGKTVTREYAEGLSREMLEKSLRETGQDVTEEAVQDLFKRVNKQKGINLDSTGVSIFGKELISGEKIAKFSDKTIAPYTTDFLRTVKSNNIAKKLSTKAPLWEAAMKNQDNLLSDYFMFMDDIKASGMNKAARKTVIKKYTDELQNLTPNARKVIAELVEDEKLWTPGKKTFASTEEASALRQTLQDWVDSYDDAFLNNRQRYSAETRAKKIAQVQEYNRNLGKTFNKFTYRINEEAATKKIKTPLREPMDTINYGEKLLKTRDNIILDKTGRNIINNDTGEVIGKLTDKFSVARYELGERGFLTPSGKVRKKTPGVKTNVDVDIVTKQVPQGKGMPFKEVDTAIEKYNPMDYVNKSDKTVREKIDFINEVIYDGEEVLWVGQTNAWVVDKLINGIMDGSYDNKVFTMDIFFHEHGKAYNDAIISKMGDSGSSLNKKQAGADKAISRYNKEMDLKKTTPARKEELKKLIRKEEEILSQVTAKRKERKRYMRMFKDMDDKGKAEIARFLEGQELDRTYHYIADDAGNLQKAFDDKLATDYADKTRRFGDEADPFFKATQTEREDINLRKVFEKRKYKSTTIQEAQDELEHIVELSKKSSKDKIIDYLGSAKGAKDIKLGATEVTWTGVGKDGVEKQFTKSIDDMAKIATHQLRSDYRKAQGELKSIQELTDKIKYGVDPKVNRRKEMMRHRYGYESINAAETKRNALREQYKNVNDNIEDILAKRGNKDVVINKDGTVSLTNVNGEQHVIKKSDIVKQVKKELAEEGKAINQIIDNMKAGKNVKQIKEMTFDEKVKKVVKESIARRTEAARRAQVAADMGRDGAIVNARRNKLDSISYKVSKMKKSNVKTVTRKVTKKLDAFDYNAARKIVSDRTTNLVLIEKLPNNTIHIMTNAGDKSVITVEEFMKRYGDYMVEEVDEVTKIATGRGQAIRGSFQDINIPEEAGGGVIEKARVTGTDTMSKFGKKERIADLSDKIINGDGFTMRSYVESTADSSIEFELNAIKEHADTYKKYKQALYDNDLLESIAVERMGREYVDKAVGKERSIAGLNGEPTIPLDTADVPENYKNVARFIRDTFKEIGEREVEQGVLGANQYNQMKAYLAHIITPEAKAKILAAKEDVGELNDDLLKWLIGDNDTFNEFSISRKLKKGAKVGDVVLKEGTVKEINEVFLDLLDGDKLFMEDMSDIFLHRMNRHYDVIYDNDVVDQGIKAFGRELDLEGSIGAQHRATINLGALNNADNVVEKKNWLRNNGFGDQIDNMFGAKLVRLDERTAKAYAKQFGSEEVAVLPDMILNKMNGVANLQAGKDTHQFLRTYDKFLSIWRVGVTTNPSFHVQNAIGNTFQNWLAIGNKVLDPDIQRNAFDLLNGKKTGIMTLGGTDYDMDYLRMLMSEFGVFDAGLFEKEIGAWKGTGLLKDKGVPGKFDPTDAKNFIPYQKSRTVGNYVENQARITNFIAGLDNGLSIEEAAEQVNKFLFDYSDLTEFEMTSMRRVFPFYTWMRKNIPLQLEQMMANPNKYRAVSKAFGEMEDMNDEKVAEKDRPSYARDWVQLPFSYKGKDGTEKAMYWNPNLPFMDVNLLPITAKGTKSLFSRMSPAITQPIEQVTGHNIYFDTPLSELYRGSSSPRLEHFLNAIPNVKTARDIITKEGDAKNFARLGAMGVKISVADKYQRKNKDLYERLNTLY